MQTRLWKFLNCLLVSAAIIAGGVGVAQAQIGITAGLNFEQTSDIKNAAGNLSRDVVLSEATGYHVGIAFEFGGDRFRLRPGILFRNVGTYSLADDADVSDAGQNFNVSVIEIPLDLRLKVLPIPYINPYVMAGPMVALPQGEGDFSDATRTWSFSGNVGGGLSIALGSVKIQPEFRYQFGVTDYISDGFTIGNETINPTETPEFSALSVRLSLLF